LVSPGTVITMMSETGSIIGVNNAARQRPILTLPPRGALCEHQHSYAGQASPFSVPMVSPAAGPPMPMLPAGNTCTPSNAASTYWRTATCPDAPARPQRGGMLSFATNSDSTPRSGLSTPSNLVCPANLWPSNCPTPVGASPWPQAMRAGPTPSDLLRSVSGQSGTTVAWPQPGTCSYPGPETRPSTIADVSMESSGPATPSPTRGGGLRVEPASISPITPPGKQDRVRHQTSGEKLAFPMS